MAQYVGQVYVSVQFDQAQATSALTQSLRGAGATAGAQAGDAMTAGMSDRLLAFGTQATRVGRQLSFGLTAPLLAVGHAADQAFVGFDTQMTKVAALTGTGIDQTQAWSNQVLDLAASYGQTGEDAAKALYLITSSGIKGAEAMKTLDTVGKSAAVGLGDMQTMAGLLTSVMNAYGSSTIDAAKAADILTGAVQESKVPADQLAGSISQLLPFGAQLGVGFDQIAGSMAALSLQGTNAAMAATQLRGIFNALLDPSAQMNKGLEKVNLTSKQLRATLSGQGVVAMIRQLKDAIVANGGDADAELANMFGNVRALTGVFGLLSNESGQIDRVFANTTNSANKLNKALEVTADTPAFKAQQASAELNAEMVKLGQNVTPIKTFFVQAASGVASFFNSLGPLKPALALLGTGLAVIGPLAYSVGAIADVFGIGFGASAGATKALTKAMQDLTAALGGVAAEGSTAGAGITDSMGAAVAATEGEVGAIAELDAALVASEGEVGQLGLFFQETFAGMAASTEPAVAAAEQLGLAFGTAGEEAIPLGPAVAESMLEAVGATEAEVAAVEQLGLALGESTLQLRLFQGQGTGGMAGMVAATEAEAAAVEGLTVAEGEATVAAGGLAATLGPLVVIAAAIGASFFIWGRAMDDMQSRVDTMTDGVKNAFAKKGVLEASLSLGELRTQVKGLSEDADNTVAPWDADKRKELYMGRDALNAVGDAVQKNIGFAGELATKTHESADVIFQWLQNQANANIVYATADDALKAFTADVAKHGGVVSQAATAEGQLADKAKDLASAYFGAHDAFTNFLDSLDKVKRAEQAVGDAERSAQAARRDQASAIQRVTDAQDKHRESLGKVRDAQNDLAEAQSAYDKLLAGPTLDEKLGVREARLGLRRAQKALTKPGKSTDPLDREQGAIDLARARERLSEAQGAHAVNLKKAQDDVTKAHQGVTSAQKDVADSAKAITDAQQGVADSAYRVRDADQAVVDAHVNVQKATWDTFTAAYNLDQKQNDFKDTIAKTNTQLDPFIKYLEGLKELYPQVADAIQPVLDQAQALNTEARNAQALAAGPAKNPLGGSITAIEQMNLPAPPQPMDPHADEEWVPGLGWVPKNRRATGGPLGRGQVSTVNERGMPELWQANGKQYLLPTTGGQVMPLKPMTNISVAGSDSPTVGTMNVYVADDPVQNAYEVRRQLSQRNRTGGRR